MIQAALPGMLFGAEPSELKILGGTNVDMSPQIDYFRFVFQPVVARMGVNFELRVVRRGTFPKVCMPFCTYVGLPSWRDAFSRLATKAKRNTKQFL